MKIYSVYTDLRSQYRRHLCTQMRSCRMFCRPPCWYMFFCCHIRRCCSGTRSHLNNTCVQSWLSIAAATSISQTPHFRLLLHQTYSPANTDLCTQHSRRLCTQMDSCRIFCHPPCWYMIVRCGTHRCCSSTRSHLINTCVHWLLIAAATTIS